MSCENEGIKTDWGADGCYTQTRQMNNIDPVLKR